MAGEYKKENYTKAQRFTNWWSYHWKWVLLALAVLVAAIYLAGDVLRQPDYDFTIGILTTENFDTELRAKLEEAFHASGIDMNGDGETLVQLQIYRFAPNTEDEAMPSIDPNQQMASITQLIASLDNPSQTVFFTQRRWLNEFQDEIGVYGTIPDGAYIETEDVLKHVVSAADCAVIQGFDLTYQDFYSQRFDGLNQLNEYVLGIRIYEEATYHTKEEFLRQQQPYRWLTGES